MNGLSCWLTMKELFQQNKELNKEEIIARKVILDSKPVTIYYK